MDTSTTLHHWPLPPPITTDRHDTIPHLGLAQKQWMLLWLGCCRGSPYLVTKAAFCGVFERPSDTKQTRLGLGVLRSFPFHFGRRKMWPIPSV